MQREATRRGVFEDWKRSTRTVRDNSDVIHRTVWTDVERSTDLRITPA